MPASGDQIVIGSLFDRLTDYEPRNSREVPPPRWEQLQSYKDGVARDLTSLLNTRRSEQDIAEDFSETRESLAAFGVQDFTTAPVDREQIRRSIERAVRIFEPRLTRVQVSLIEAGVFKVAFRITGLLRMAVGMEPVVYDADLPKDARRIRVTVGR